MSSAETSSYDLRDLRSFERLYHDHFAYVWAVLRRLDVDSVADALQDVFVTAYRKRDSYDPSRPIRPWLVGIARRIASRTRRGQQRYGRKRDALAAAEHLEAPRHVLQARVEARQFLNRFAGELDERHREVFVLGELQGCTGSEIAQQLGIGIDAAYGRLRKVRKRLEQAVLETQPRSRPEPARVQRGFALLLPVLRRPAAGAGVLSSVSAKVWVAAGGLVMTTIAVVAIGSREPKPSHETKADAVVVATPDERLRTTEGSSDDQRSEVQPSAPAPTPETVETPPPSLQPGPVSPGSRTPAPLVHERPQAPPVEADDLDTQARALARVRRTLDAQRANEAMTLLEEHAQKFPNSPLAQARAALRVEVLCAQGKGPQARGEAATLLRQHPDSNLARHAATVCPE